MSNQPDQPNQSTTEPSVTELLHFETRIWIGSRTGLDGEQDHCFDLPLLTQAVGVFQKSWEDEHSWVISTRITPTFFVCKDYNESGWEISLINYPRRPREPEETEQFTRALAHYLLIRFEQYRVSFTNGKTVTMLSADVCDK